MAYNGYVIVVARVPLADVIMQILNEEYRFGIEYSTDYILNVIQQQLIRVDDDARNILGPFELEAATVSREEVQAALDGLITQKRVMFFATPHGGYYDATTESPQHAQAFFIRPHLALQTEEAPMKEATT